ncbi:MAG TPA: EAL domain-containing protein [Steroidobacteraceae bacterium]|nr:EAL domain-containing protein [Steroidobacteraceae bacterium]
MLFVICVLTIRSIVLPVRRMLRATARVASGDMDARVPRGGIKELDTLAIAFNHMAEQVAAARTLANEYQHQLEDKVEQRTRELQQLAEHDPLTLLPNRRQLLARLHETITGAAARSLHVCVYFVDIDNFKNINDSMGHAFGDQVLRGVAQRLQVFSSRIGFAARWGGDEFTVVHQQALGPETVQDCGRQLVEVFHDPISVAGRELVVTISVGASLYPEHATSAEDLLSASDAALFRAKALGRNRLALFAPELLVSATNRFTTEQSLRRALEQAEFELHFQPELNLENLTVDLVEALIRWRQPDGRLALPDEFLGIAEDSGLILELGDWVLRKAISTASAWHHGAWPDVRVAINVSPRQLLTHAFVARVLALLQEFRLPPHCIELELTESVLQSGPAIIDAMRDLQSSGIAIALDDFGTGYSSLASLGHLPLNRIKLDKSLIDNIDSTSRSAVIAGAIIDLCAALGLEVTAEGIERPQQVACLLGHRRMHLQGYLISHAVQGPQVLALRETIFLRMQEILAPIRSASGPGERPDRKADSQHPTPLRLQRG